MSLLLLGLLTVVQGSYVSLDLQFSNDNSGDPSRALVGNVLLGIPERRKTLMLDFKNDDIEFDTCLRVASRTFDVMGSESDVVQFEEDSLLDIKQRAYFRMPLKQHCEGVLRPLPLRYYESCLNPERCDGILGMRHTSSIWQIWTAYSISLEKLHIGRKNPYVRRVPDDYIVRQKKQKIEHRARIGDKSNYDDDDDETDTLECSGSKTQSICEYDATLGGVHVVVDFHTEDSYIYVPQRIYSLYMAEVVRVDSRNEKKEQEHRRKIRERFQRKRDVSNQTPPLIQEPPEEDHVKKFSAAMKQARIKAMSESVFFRNSLHSETHSHWLPLVFEPRHNSTATIVIDFDLINHSPRYSNSFGGVERSSSDRFFADSAPSDLTLMMKVHPTEPHSNRVSIGNGFFRRYEIHNDLLQNRALVIRRLIIEHLSTWESVLATLLYTFFIRSVCNSLEMLAPLMLGLPIVCSGCLHHENIFAPHRRTTYNVFREAVVYTFALVVPLLALIRLVTFVNTQRHRDFFVWAWLVIGANSLVLLVNLIYSTTSVGGRRPPSGSYCWRSFRIIETRSASSEQLMIIGVLIFTFVLHRDTLGSVTTSIVGLLMLTNAVRHLYHCIRYSSAVLYARDIEPIEENKERIMAQDQVTLFPIATNQRGQTDEPSSSAQKLWIVYCLFVLIGINVVGSIVFVAKTIVWPTLHSGLFTALIILLAVYFAIYVVNNFGRGIIAARKLKVCVTEKKK